jgi:hypothetical protein
MVTIRDVLEFFSVREILPLALLIGLLEFTGTQMGGNHGRVRWLARGLAGAGFLLYGVAAIADWEPATPGEFLRITVQALLAMGTAHGLARVVLPIVCFLYEHLWQLPRERNRAWEDHRQRIADAEKEASEKAEREQAERNRQEEAERRRLEEIANRPPPPTREELLASAKERYESTVRLLASAALDATERQAAEERAKQQYLREIEKAMQ